VIGDILKKIFLIQVNIGHQRLCKISLIRLRKDQ